jgi:hypothetical protein
VKDRPITGKGIGAVQKQHLQVDVQVEGGAEALDQGDRTGAGAAARAKAAPFAAKRHQVFMPTTITLDAQKTVFQQAALQVVNEFLAHEFWQAGMTVEMD